MQRELHFLFHNMPIHFPVTFGFFGKEVLLHPVLESVGIFLAMRYYFYLKKEIEGEITS